MPIEISNDALTLSDIPPSDADFDTLCRFGHTFDGYEEMGSFEACAAIANARSHDNLTEARACLFFEMRRWRHFGETPDEEAISYMRQLVASIRRYVEQGIER